MTGGAEAEVPIFTTVTLSGAVRLSLTMQTACRSCSNEKK
jgi:hypothetical protein